MQVKEHIVNSMLPYGHKGSIKLQYSVTELHVYSVPSSCTSGLSIRSNTQFSKTQLSVYTVAVVGIIVCLVHNIRSLLVVQVVFSAEKDVRGSVSPSMLTISKDNSGNPGTNNWLATLHYQTNKTR